MINIKIKKALIAAVIASVSMSYPNVTVKAEEIEMKEMYRLYNPNSGEHFYTAKAKERDDLVKLGWKDEGIGWFAPEKSESPVYRLYNKYGGEHHYTLNEAEKDALVKAGWTDEGIGWYSDDEKVVPVFREYNPNAQSCNHNYTVKFREHEALDKAGWDGEGVGWYGVENETHFTEEHPYTWENVTVTSLFDDMELGLDDIPGSAEMMASSETTNIGIYTIVDSEYEELGLKKGTLMEVAESMIARDNKGKDKLLYCQLENVENSYVRITRTRPVPKEFDPEKFAGFDVTGLFEKGGVVYMISYSCPEKYRPEYEKLFNYCLNKTVIE